MRFAVLLLLTPLVHAQSLVDGQVLNAVTGGGIEGVQVELVQADGAATSYRTASDPSGAFRLTVNDGGYKVTYRKAGFAGNDFDRQNSITVGNAASVHLRRELDPLTTLRGRTSSNITVELLTAKGQVRRSLTTDARGDFHFDELLPGAYLLRANPNRTDAGTAEAQTAEGPRVMMTPSYYPGVPDRAQASVIHAAGGELSGYDVKLRPGPVFKVRGHLFDVEGRALARVPVELVSGDAWNLSPSNYPEAMRPAIEKQRALVATGDDGGFEFANVSAGNWHLIAGKPMGVLGVLPVAVTRHDLEDLVLRMTTLFPLSVTFEGLTEQTPQVHLVPVSGAPHHEAYSGRVAEGEKEKRLSVDIYPDRYRFTMANLPGHYLAAILLGGRDVLGEEVELADGALPVRIVYRSDGGRIAGKVEDGGFSKVVIVARNPGLRSQFEVARCDADGRFEVDSLRPGEYLAVALRHTAVTEDPLWMATLEQRAVSVHVEAERTVSITLRVQ